MSLATRLQPKVDKLLAKYQITDRPVYKRYVTKTGGDALIGVGQTVTTVDTLLNPQPTVKIPVKRYGQLVAGGIYIVGNAAAELGDYLLFISTTALSDAEFDIPPLIVFKSGTKEEVCFIVSYETTTVNGVNLAHTALIRSQKQ